MPHAKRTQVYLSPDAYRILEALASRRRSSVASLVREAVARYVSESDLSELHDQDPLWSILACAKGNQADGALRHDEYIYGKGDPKPRRPRRNRLRR